LPRVISCDAQAYAWLYDGAAAAWQLLPRNEARVLHGEKKSGKQLTGTLTLDGCSDVPAISGENVLLLFRKETNFKRYPGLPANESGIEVTRLECQPGAKPGTLIRTARLQRLGESAATFGAKREPITVEKYAPPDGVYHLIRVTAPLAAGRYALYLPDRAFEFEVR